MFQGHILKPFLSTNLVGRGTELLVATLGTDCLGKEPMEESGAKDEEEQSLWKPGSS